MLSLDGGTLITGADTLHFGEAPLLSEGALLLDALIIEEDVLFLGEVLM